MGQDSNLHESVQSIDDEENKEVKDKDIKSKSIDELRNLMV